MDHKRTFLWLEQEIVRRGAADKATGVETKPAGLDFFFADKSEANRFLHFLQHVVPCRHKQAKQLVSADLKSNVGNYKHTYAVDIAPLCKDDLVLLPTKTATTLGGMARLAVVFRVSQHVHLVDPQSLQTAELTAERYFAEPFRSVLQSPRLVEMVVLDVAPAAIEVAAPTGDNETPLTAASAGGAGVSQRTLRKKALQKRRAKRHGGRRRKGRRAVDSDSDEDDMDLEGEADPSKSVAGSVAGKSRSGRARGGAGSVTVGGRAVERGAGRHAVPSDARSMVTSVPGAARSVGAGQGGMGGVLVGSRVWGAGTEVSTTVTGGPRGKFLLADVTVARARDFGVNDIRFTVRSHLGNILRAGDTVLGYDLESVSLPGMEEEDAEGARLTAGGGAGAGLPPVLIVRKMKKKGKRRKGGGKGKGKGAATGGASSGASGASSGASGASVGPDEEGTSALTGASDMGTSAGKDDAGEEGWLVGRSAELAVRMEGGAEGLETVAETGEGEDDGK